MACLSFVCGSLRLLYPDTLGVPFPPLGGLPPIGELSVHRMWFALFAVFELFGSLASHTYHTLAADLVKFAHATLVTRAANPVISVWMW